MSKINIYVLKLESGKYYIGKSNDIHKRFQQHLNGIGSSWTKKYKPLKIEKIINNTSPFDEDKVTKELMDKYGIDNVRGGSYSNIELSDFQIETIKTEIWGATDLCSQCGHKGHFIKDCYAKIDVFGKSLKKDQEDDEEEDEEEDDEEEDEEEDDEEDEEDDEEDEEDDEEDDYDSDEWLCNYCDRTFTTQFGCNIHKKSCKEKNNLTQSSLYDNLIQYRTNEAKRLRVAPYRIFTNQSLEEIIKFKPINEKSLTNIHGIGDAKIREFGKDIIKIVKHNF